MAKTWILVAHRAGARILENDGPGKGLSLVRELEHEEGRRFGREIDSDRPGRTFDRYGPGRHAKSREESAPERTAADFARTLGEQLRQARNQHRFDRLVLVAEPRFLGHLREALDRPTADRVTAELAKDLAAVDIRQLADHLGEVMAV